MCKEREYKRLDTVSNAFSVPVPGTRKRKTIVFLFIFPARGAS